MREDIINLELHKGSQNFFHFQPRIVSRMWLKSCIEKRKLDTH